MKLYMATYYDTYNFPKYPILDGDCTNYLSQVVEAGGLEQNSNWYMINKGRRHSRSALFRMLLDAALGHKPITYNTENYVYSYSRSWTSVKDSYNYFSGSKLVYDPIILTAQNYEDQVKEHFIETGDLLYFCEYKQGDITHAGVVYEVINNDVLYSGHTASRLNRPLSEFFLSNPDASIIVLMWRPE